MTTPWRSGSPALIAFAALTLAVAATAEAQVTRVEDPIRPLEPVDQTVADLHVLSTSLRVVEPGIQEPASFRELYRIAGEDGEPLLMRASGGIYAVFPQSVYAFGRRGPVPLVPPGTRFFIGAPPVEPEPVVPHALAMIAEPIDGLQWRIDTRLQTAIASPPTVPADVAAATSPPAVTALRDATSLSVATDPGYRLARLRQLIDRAASVERDGQAARGRSSSPSK